MTTIDARLARIEGLIHQHLKNSDERHVETNKKIDSLTRDGGAIDLIAKTVKRHEATKNYAMGAMGVILALMAYLKIQIADALASVIGH